MSDTAIGAASRPTHHTEQGAGFPLILIHGVGMDLSMWDAHAGPLADRYRVIRYDMLGHGRSPRPPGPYSLQQFVDQLRALMDDLGIPRAHILGFSMGGLVAQAFAQQYPERTASLILANAVAERSEREREAVLDRVRAVERSGHTATIDAAIERWFTRGYAVAHPETLEAVRRTLEANDPDGYLAAYRVFATADQEVSPRLEEIERPTLAITGEHDVGSTPEMARLMGARIPDAEVVVVPGMRHMLPVEAPDVFTAEILRFLAAHAREEA